MLERDHDSQCRMTDGGNHWLQGKDRIVLELTGIHLRDQLLPDGLFLDDNNCITTKRATISLPDFERENSKQILFKKQYQNEQERIAQFELVTQLDRITGKDGKFINWSDILDSAWDAPELCEAGVISDRFVIGHWDDLSVLHDPFRRRLVYFLKSTFTDEMDHNHIDNIMSQKETYGLLVCGYKIDDEDIDIFSCLIFEYLNQDDFEAPTGIVYIATSPIFRGLKLAPFMLSVLSNLLLVQRRSCILIASTSPSNEDWYVSQQFQYIHPDNKFDNDEFQIDKKFAVKVFQFCVRHNYLDDESGLQYDKDGNECEFLKFMILDECHSNDKYIPTKRLFDLTRDIYFLPVSKENLQIVNVSNKIVDAIIGGLERASDVKVDTTDKIRLYDKTLHSLELSKTNLIRILHPKDGDKDFMKSLDVVLSDPYRKLKRFISNNVSFPLSFLTYNWNTILCNLPSVYFSKGFKYRSWMSVLSKLNAIEIREVGVEDAKSTFSYGLYCSCCKKFITDHEGFSDSITKLLGWLQIAVDVHYGTYCKIKPKNKDAKKKSSDKQVFSSMCFDPAKFNKMADDVNARNIEFLPCDALNSSKEEFSMKTLELINSLKVDKLTYPSSSTIKSQWIDAFFESINRKQVVASIKTYLQTQKENMFDEINPIISQLERESVQYAIEVLESFQIDFKRISKLSVAKAMVKKTLQQVLLDRSIDFDKAVRLPPRLVYEQKRIKNLPLFQTFSFEGPLTMSWSNLPSKVDFKSSLEIDKWSKRSRRKSFKASLSMSGKTNQDVVVLLPSLVKELDVCPIPYIKPITYSKFTQYEDLPDASGWNDDESVMKVCGPNWCKDAPEMKVSSSLEQAIEDKRKQLGFDDTYDEDPYLQETVLRNMHMVSIFGCNKPLDNDCKKKVVWYQDKLWKSNVRIFGKCLFDPKFLRSHEKLSKYLTKYTQPFEVIDSVVRQFPLKEIKALRNKGWVRIPKDIKLKINEIADKIRGVTIRTIMPCVTNKKSAHLLSVQGDNRKHLVTNIPRNTLFALDMRLLDYSSCTLFACQEEIYFGVGQRNTDNDENLNQYQQFPLQCKMIFDNDDHQCVLGAFMKMCCEVLTTSGRDSLMKYICNHKKFDTNEYDLSKMLNDARCGILKKEEHFHDDSSDAKRWIMDHAYTEQPFLVAIRGKMNSIGHCIGIVQNMIIDATLMNGVELSCDSLDAVLGETVTEIIWCRSYYPTSDKVRPSLSIQTSTDFAQARYNNVTRTPLHNVSEHPIPYRPIQCKILFENCAGKQVLGSFAKLVSETLLVDAYTALEERVIKLQGESVVGINTCNSVLTDMQLGRFVKYKKTNDTRTTVKEWIMDYATKGQPFLISVYNKQTRTETCIGVTNTMIVESQLLGGIDLNKANLERELGKGDVELMWCRTFYPHKDKMKCGLRISTMQELMKSGKKVW